MSRYSTIALPHAHAARARQIAEHLGIPVGALISSLIDTAYEHEFDVRPTLVTVNGVEFIIELGDSRVSIPCASAATYAAQLRTIASDGGGFLDVDHPAMLSISRKGSAVVIETSIGKKLRRTMGVAEANRLADEIAALA